MLGRAIMPQAIGNISISVGLAKPVALMVSISGFRSITTMWPMAMKSIRIKAFWRPSMACGFFYATIPHLLAPQWEILCRFGHPLSVEYALCPRPCERWPFALGCFFFYHKRLATPYRCCWGDADEFPRCRWLSDLERKTNSLWHGQRRGLRMPLSF